MSSPEHDGVASLSMQFRGFLRVFHAKHVYTVPNYHNSSYNVTMLPVVFVFAVNMNIYQYVKIPYNFYLYVVL